MPRIIKKIAHSPYEVKPQAKSVLVCMCGLSKNQPFCDGSHLKTTDEDKNKTYEYDENGKRQEIDCCCSKDDKCEGCKPGVGCCGEE